jgi:2'-5' RNA ligase
MNAPIVVKNREQGKSTASQRPLRLFFALWPHRAQAQALHQQAGKVQRECGGRVMRAETVHMTLLFLGDTPAGRLSSLKEAAQAVQGPAFEMHVDELRGWRHNAIVFAAPSKCPAPLTKLVADLRENVAAAGFHFDANAFNPHVTLLRKAERIPDVQQLDALPWRVKEFVLVQSVPDDGRMRYDIIGRWPLSPGMRSPVIPTGN